jgi:hypothetical protein
MGTGRNFGDKSVKCMILGLAHLACFSTGLVINEFERPENAWIAFGIALGMATVVVTSATLFSTIVRHELAYGSLVMCAYTPALTSLVWCTDTGDVGFTLCGQVGLVFLVLVYYNRLSTRDLEYKVAKLQEEKTNLLAETI